MKERLQAKVNLLIHKENKHTGKVKSEEYHNLTVNSGLDLIRDFFYGDAVEPLNFFAVGTGTTAEAETDTQLVTEVHRDQFTKKTKITHGVEFQYYLSSTTANGNVISEAGLFGNGATATANTGIMYARVTFPGEEKTSAEAWTFRWTLTWEVV
jgi:hypothetical protein